MFSFLFFSRSRFLFVVFVLSVFFCCVVLNCFFVAMRIADRSGLARYCPFVENDVNLFYGSVLV